MKPNRTRVSGAENEGRYQKVTENQNASTSIAMK